jgi:branched-chain amino acid transport system ATP-binding protein
MSSRAVALQLNNVSKSYGAVRAVRDVSFEIMAGERRALIGPNGAGKTTLFHVISGMVPVTAGRIAFFGRDITALSTHRRMAVGMARTFQITNLFLELTVIENVVLALQALEATKFSMLRPLRVYGSLLVRAEALLDEWELTERQGALVRELSYGEQRTLEILLGVAQKPKLLLLDEPTAGLSPAETATAAALIDKLPRHTSILLIEHDMDIALQLCDSLTVLHLGEALVSGAKEEVRKDPRVRRIYLGEGADTADEDLHNAFPARGGA